MLCWAPHASVIWLVSLRITEPHRGKNQELSSGQERGALVNDDPHGPHFGTWASVSIFEPCHSLPCLSRYIRGLPMMCTNIWGDFLAAPTGGKKCADAILDCKVKGLDALECFGIICSALSPLMGLVFFQNISAWGLNMLVTTCIQRTVRSLLKVSWRQLLDQSTTSCI
jgi:hypothetical protein